MCRPSYLHLALLLALVSSTVTTANAKTSTHHHLRQSKRALLSIRQEQNSDQPTAVNNEVDSATTPTVGLPYTELVEPSTSSDDSSPQDRHSPVLPDRVPHDPEPPKIIKLVPGGNETSSGEGSNDPSLGLPFIVVIGGGTLFALTAVIVAAKKMRSDDEDEEDEDDDEDINDDDVEAADVAKEGSAVTKPAMDFSSIVPGNDDASQVVTEVVDSSIDDSSDTDGDDYNNVAPAPLLAGNGDEANEEKDDNALLLTGTI